MKKRPTKFDHITGISILGHALIYFYMLNYNASFLLAYKPITCIP